LRWSFEKVCEGVEVIFWEERERVLIERESVCERVRERDIYTVRERERVITRGCVINYLRDYYIIIVVVVGWRAVWRRCVRRQ